MHSTGFCLLESFKIQVGMLWFRRTAATSLKSIIPTTSYNNSLRPEIEYCFNLRYILNASKKKIQYL